MDSARVLLAEDDDDLRTALANALESDGVSVVSVASGSDALSALSEGGFDLVITDVRMPSPAGVQVAAMARTAGEDVPFLVITGSREPWIADTVGQLQRAELLYKPFVDDEFLERVHALIAQRPPHRIDVSDEQLATSSSSSHVYPPALVPSLRAHLADDSCIAEIPDDVLVELLTVVFFAGLATEEGERHAVRIVFAGTGAPDPVAQASTTPLYRWSPTRFCADRPFTVREVVKLALCTASDRVFIEVQYSRDRLLIAGLTREGINLEGDRCLKVIAPKPGTLSIRVGRQHLLEYEHGRVQVGEGDILDADGSVRRALALSAIASGLTPDGVPGYIHAVRGLVMGLVAHGAGGILIFSAEEEPRLAGDSGYRTCSGVSLVSVLKGLSSSEVPQEQLLRGTLLSELESRIEEIGGLTALDGATVLNRSLAIAAFGVILPVLGDVSVVEVKHPEALDARPHDFGTRGTRHRAAATYATQHPGSVVVVASSDGNVSCLFRAPAWERVALWRLMH